MKKPKELSKARSNLPIIKEILIFWARTACWCWGDMGRFLKELYEARMIQLI